MSSVEEATAAQLERARARVLEIAGELDSQAAELRGEGPVRVDVHGQLHSLEGWIAGQFRMIADRLREAFPAAEVERARHAERDLLEYLESEREMFRTARVLPFARPR